MDGLRCLLDTNILSALIRRPQGSVAAVLARRGYATVCTSIIVAAELRFGARKLGSDTWSEKVESLLASMPVLPLEDGADHAGHLTGYVYRLTTTQRAKYLAAFQGSSPARIRLRNKG